MLNDLLAAFDRVKAAENEVDMAQRVYLTKGGWRFNCDLPDFVWRCEKDIKGKRVVLDIGAAVSVQRAEDLNAYEAANNLCEQRLTDDNESAACGPSARHEG